VTSPVGPRSDDAIAEAVQRAYAAAGLEPRALPAWTPIAPLRQLVAAQPLIAEELPGLTHRTASAYLAGRIGRSLVDDRRTERLAGLLYANAGGGWILVEHGDRLPRRRFTIAHELGHYLLHVVPLLQAAAELPEPSELEFEEVQPRPNGQELDESEQDGVVHLAGAGALHTDDGAAERMEDEANRFAALLLLPESVCRELSAAFADRCGGKRPVLARRLAAECLVSQVAMLRRLTDLGLP
jgi:hypothetical protein